MKTGYMMMRYVTKKESETNHIVSLPKFITGTEKARCIYMNDIEAGVAFEEIVNDVLDAHDNYKEDQSERTFDTRVLYDKESGFSYVYRLATVLLQE